MMSSQRLLLNACRAACRVSRPNITASGAVVGGGASSSGQKARLAAVAVIGAVSGAGYAYCFPEEASPFASLADSGIAKCEAVMLAPQKEPATGIVFPHLCNGMQLVGCGVRVKWGFVKVYAVGTYMDPIAMNAVKKQGSKEIEKALLDPMYPRTIRIVMNRSLSIDKYTSAIVEALEPRMGGQDLVK